MRDAEAGLGVFRDPEEFQYYKNMFHNLTDIMTEVGFSDEVINELYDKSKIHWTNLVLLWWCVYSSMIISLKRFSPMVYDQKYESTINGTIHTILT